MFGVDCESRKECAPRNKTKIEKKTQEVERRNKAPSQSFKNLGRYFEIVVFSYNTLNTSEKFVKTLIGVWDLKKEDGLNWVERVWEFDQIDCGFSKN